MSTTTARIIIGTAIGTAGFVVGFLAGAGEGGPVAAVVAMPLMGSALGAALPGSRKAGCDVGTRFLRGLVGSAAGTAAAIAMAERSRGTRDAMAVAAVVTIMVTPAVGATLTMGDCRR